VPTHIACKHHSKRFLLNFIAYIKHKLIIDLTVKCFSLFIGAPIRMLAESPEKTGYIAYEYDEKSILLWKASG
jgi:hypothetical protein